jgi:hypothetical protein
LATVVRERGPPICDFFQKKKPEVFWAAAARDCAAYT